MRIAHILNQVEDVGNGIVWATVELACEQAKAGHEVFVLSAGGGLVPLLESHGVTHVKVVQKMRPLVALRAWAVMYRFLSTYRPDIVHAQMMTGVVLARMLKPFHAFKLVSTVHNEWNKHAILMGWADCVTAPSEKVRESMIKRGISARKLVVIRNGMIGGVKEKRVVDTQLQLQRPSITTVAGLYHHKGISCLIKAFELVKQRIPEAHLYIVGHGDDRAEFEAQAAASSVSADIHFEGFQRHAGPYFQQTDVFVLPSLQESFGLALSEARAAGCAVIGSNVGGIPEVLEQGRAGQIFSADNAEQLAAMISELLFDAEMLTFWQKRAQENLHWLSVQRVHEETETAYRSLIAGAS